MKTIPFGNTDLQTTPLIFGCSRIAGTNHPQEVTDERVEQGIQILESAWAAGYRAFDVSDFYCGGQCERIIGRALQRHPGWKDAATWITKVGIRVQGDPEPDSPERYDFSYDHIMRSCDASLERLGLDCIDLYLLHRPDYLANVREVARALQQLHREGKVRHIGVSNFFPHMLERYQAALDLPIATNQIQISLLHRDPIFDGTIDYMMLHNIVPIAWSPIGHGKLVKDADPEKDPAMARLQTALDAEADRLGPDYGRAEVALAWLRSHPAGILPIVGTITPERIRKSTAAARAPLSHQAWYRLLQATQDKRLFLMRYPVYR